jgi:hypothetical protein
MRHDSAAARRESEVQVNDDQDVVTGSLHPGSSAAAGLQLCADVDLAGIAGLVLDAAVHRLADAAGVYVLEHLLADSSVSWQDPGGRVALRRLGARLSGSTSPDLAEAFRSGEAVVLPTGSPCVQSMRDGGPIIFTQPDRETLQRSRPADRAVFDRYASFLAVPLTASGVILGFVAFARSSGAPVFRASDADEAVRLGGVAATGIGNALALIRQRAVVDALQHGLLAADPPRPSGCEVAGRCVPAAGQAIGGDWYDIIPLPGERTGLVVGDVMGHGPEAAAVMVQLRATAHALAELDLPPAELLSRLDRVTATLRQSTLATCVYAVIDPRRGSCTLSAAGHLPPVLVMPGGTTRVPDLPAGQSLGLGSGIYGEAHVHLPPGTVIALYTDGLVETRTRAFDQGILALRSALADEHGSLEDVCDELLGTLAGQHEDDVTLILARIPS